MSKKNGSCMADRRKNRPGIASGDFQMLRGNGIGNVYGKLHGRHQNNRPPILQGARGNLGTRESCALSVKFRWQIVSQMLVRGDDDGTGQRVMFGLREEVCCEIFQIG